MRTGDPRFALATGIVLALTAMLAWTADHWVLAPLGLGYLHTLVLVLVAGTLAQAALAAMKRPPEMPAALLMFACAVLAVAFPDPQPTLLRATLQGAGLGLSVGIALILFGAMRERLDAADVPVPFRGAPVALLTAAFVALALLGLAGLGAR